MAELQRMVSGKIGEKNLSVCLPNATTHRLENPEEIFSALSVKLDGIQAWKWNYEQVIIFQSVILQRGQAVNNSKTVCAKIEVLTRLL